MHGGFVLYCGSLTAPSLVARIYTVHRPAGSSNISSSFIKAYFHVYGPRANFSTG